MNSRDLDIIRQKIGGYAFQNPDLLQQAFTRRSYSEENGGEDNEVLEFIGDKVLDFLVVKMLAETYGCVQKDGAFACEKDEAELTELKKRLVQKKTLAGRIDALGLAEYLITGKGDCGDSPSVKEDLFEAILGAAAIDSGWDMSRLEVLVSDMLVPDMLLSRKDENYITLIEQWMSKKGYGRPKWVERRNPSAYQIDVTTGQTTEVRRKYFECKLWIAEDIAPFCGEGYSAREARLSACAEAYAYLHKKGLWFSVCTEIPNPNKDDAINQLEILARRGYFSIPTYEYEEKYDGDGNPVWHCECRIEERERTFSAVSSSTKKDAKKTAAYAMLLDVLENGGDR